MTPHFVRKVKVGKPIRWYVYAYRGGPLITKHDSPKRPKLSAAEWAQVAEAQELRLKAPQSLFRSLIQSWRRSPEWAGLAKGTRDLWGRHLDLIEKRWGETPIEIWNSPRLVTKIIAWRNERRLTPRTADIGVTVLNSLLEFSRLQGQLAINISANIPRLYKGGNRQEIVWLEDEIERFRVVAEKNDRAHVYDSLRLAMLTGMRREDLVTLTFAQVGDLAIVKTALKKSGGKRRRAVIPMTPKLEALLVELRNRPRKDGVETVLVNSRGRPWTPGGLTGSFNLIRDEADIHFIDDEGTKIMKHLHDVRGTFCTMLLTDCKLKNDVAAEIMAWSPERVATIRKVYVDQSRVLVALASRIAVNQGVNQ